jgi:transcription elongation factor Elf1
MTLIKQGLTKQEIKDKEIDRKLYKTKQIKKWVKKQAFKTYTLVAYGEHLKIKFKCPICDSGYETVLFDWEFNIFERKESSVGHITCPNCKEDFTKDELWKEETDIAKVLSDAEIDIWVSENKAKLYQEFEKQYIESEQEFEQAKGLSLMFLNRVNKEEQ